MILEERFLYEANIIIFIRKYTDLFYLGLEINEINVIIWKKTLARSQSSGSVVA